MKAVSLTKEISSTSYPGRGIVLGRSADGKKAVIAYFIMGRSENSRNRIFVETGPVADHLRACTRSRQQDHRNKRRPDRYYLRAYEPAAHL